MFQTADTYYLTAFRSERQDLNPEDCEERSLGHEFPGSRNCVMNFKAPRLEEACF